MDNSEKIQIIKQLVKSSDEVDKIPLRIKNENDKKFEVIELSNSEHSLLRDFQDFLFDRGYISDKIFESLFIYIFNLAMFLHKSIAEYEIENENHSTRKPKDAQS